MKAAAERRVALLVLIAMAAMIGSGVAVVRAADPDKEADEDLLEFLGSVGGEDAEFTDYLSRTDIAQAAKPPPKPAPPPPEVKKS
jgi:hypothetical protein